MTALTALSRAEFILLRRNKLLMFNAVLFPLLPVVIMVVLRDRLDATAARAILDMALMFVLLFVVFYNLLSSYVARREELVLNRLRVGEISDRMVLAGTAAPSIAMGVAMSTVLIVLSCTVGGVAAPRNPLFVVLGVLGGIAVFTALALITTAFTRNSEAAQITSLPVVVLAIVPGWLGELSSEPVRRLLDLTPYAPVTKLLDLGFDGGAIADAGQPVLIMLAWIVGGGLVAAKAFRWEPRA